MGAGLGCAGGRGGRPRVGRARRRRGGGRARGRRRSAHRRPPRRGVPRRAGRLVPVDRVRRRRRRLLARRVGAGAARDGTPLAVLAVPRATGVLGRTVRADRIARPPRRCRREPRALLGRRPATPARRPTSPTESPRVSGCASANGTPAAASAAPRPSNSNAPRGSTTSPSRRGTWSSSSHRRRVSASPRHPVPPCPSRGCREPRAGSASSPVAATAPGCGGSGSTPAWSPTCSGVGGRTTAAGCDRSSTSVATTRPRRAALRPGAIGRRAAGRRPHVDRRRPRRPRALARDRGPPRAGAGRRPVGGVSTPRRRARGCGVPLRLQRRARVGGREHPGRRVARRRSGAPHGARAELRARRPAEVRPGPRGRRGVASRGRAPSERTALRAGGRRARRRRGLAAQRRRRRQPRDERRLRPRRLHDGARTVPRRSSTCRSACRCAATGNGCRPTATADVGLAHGARARPFSPRHDTFDHARGPTARLCLPTDRAAGGQRGPAPPGDLGPPQPAPGGRRRARPPQGVARRRRHVHGRLAGPAVRRGRGDGPRVGHRRREAEGAAQDLRCALTGEALLRPGEAARRGGQARDRRQARRAGDPLVGQAGPRARDRHAPAVRRAGDGLVRPPLPPLRRPPADADRASCRRISTPS